MSDTPSQTSITVKFMCDRIVRTKSGCEALLSPVQGNSPENQRFYKYTPAGKLELFTINQNMAQSLIPGQEYYLTVSSNKPTSTQTEADLVAFGNYLLEKYQVRVHSNAGNNTPLYDHQVTDADLANWRAEQQTAPGLPLGSHFQNIGPI